MQHRHNFLKHEVLMPRTDPNKLAAFPSGPLVRGVLPSQVYEILEQIGEGGFGTTFRARNFGPRKVWYGPYCLKLLQDQRSWHGEAYFGELLKGDSRVIQLLDAFPYTVQAGGSVTLYFVLVSEYAPQGDLRSYLAERGAWREVRAVHEIVALLGVVERLHSIGILHRDLTPMNILVDARGRLKLADFGIARTAYAKPGVTADLRNQDFVTKGHAAHRHRYWTTQDDVYQLGQLLAMLLTGDAEGALSVRRLKRLTCSERVKRVILKATGARPHRYPHAMAMAAALQGKEQTTTTTLKGKRLTITGILSMPREEAIIRIQQAGGQYQDKIRSNTDIVVVGRPSPAYPNGGRKGGKLKYVLQHSRRRMIITISEMEFLSLTDRRRRKPS